MGEIGQGTISDLALLVEGFAEKDGGRGVAIRESNDIHDFISVYGHKPNKSRQIFQLHDYKSTPKIAQLS
jgi:hypothetical protein